MAVYLYIFHLGHPESQSLVHPPAAQGIAWEFQLLEASGSAPDLLHQKLWEWGLVIWVLTSPLGDCVALSGLRTNDLVKLEIFL